MSLNKKRCLILRWFSAALIVPLLVSTTPVAWAFPTPPRELRSTAPKLIPARRAHVEEIVETGGVASPDTAGSATVATPAAIPTGAALAQELTHLLVKAPAGRYLGLLSNDRAQLQQAIETAQRNAEPPWRERVPDVLASIYLDKLTRTEGARTLNLMGLAKHAGLAEAVIAGMTSSDHTGFGKKYAAIMMPESAPAESPDSSKPTVPPEDQAQIRGLFRDPAKLISYLTENEGAPTTEGLSLEAIHAAITTAAQNVAQEGLRRQRSLATSPALRQQLAGDQTGARDPAFSPGLLLESTEIATLQMPLGRARKRLLQLVATRLGAQLDHDPTQYVNNGNVESLARAIQVQLAATRRGVTREEHGKGAGSGSASATAPAELKLPRGPGTGEGPGAAKLDSDDFVHRGEHLNISWSDLIDVGRSGELDAQGRRGLSFDVEIQRNELSTSFASDRSIHITARFSGNRLTLEVPSNATPIDALNAIMAFRNHVPRDVQRAYTPLIRSRGLPVAMVPLGTPGSSRSPGTGEGPGAAKRDSTDFGARRGAPTTSSTRALPQNSTLIPSSDDIAITISDIARNVEKNPSIIEPLFLSVIRRQVLATRGVHTYSQVWYANDAALTAVEKHFKVRFSEQERSDATHGTLLTHDLAMIVWEKLIRATGSDPNEVLRRKWGASYALAEQATVGGKGAGSGSASATAPAASLQDRLARDDLQRLLTQVELYLRKQGRAAQIAAAQRALSAAASADRLRVLAVDYEIPQSQIELFLTGGTASKPQVAAMKRAAPDDAQRRPVAFLFDTLNNAREPLTIADLVAQTGLTESRVVTILTALRSWGLVARQKDKPTTYWLSVGSRMRSTLWPILAAIPLDAPLTMDQCDQLRPYLLRVAQEHGAHEVMFDTARTIRSGGLSAETREALEPTWRTARSSLDAAIEHAAAIAGTFSANLQRLPIRRSSTVREVLAAAGVEESTRLRGVLHNGRLEYANNLYLDHRVWEGDVLLYEPKTDSAGSAESRAAAPEPPKGGGSSTPGKKLLGAVALAGAMNAAQPATMPADARPMTTPTPIVRKVAAAPSPAIASEPEPVTKAGALVGAGPISAAAHAVVAATVGAVPEGPSAPLELEARTRQAASPEVRALLDRVVSVEVGELTFRAQLRGTAQGSEVVALVFDSRKPLPPSRSERQALALLMRDAQVEAAIAKQRPWKVYVPAPLRGVFGYSYEVKPDQVLPELRGLFEGRDQSLRPAIALAPGTRQQASPETRAVLDAVTAVELMPGDRLRVRLRSSHEAQQSLQQPAARYLDMWPFVFKAPQYIDEWTDATGKFQTERRAVTSDELRALQLLVNDPQVSERLTHVDGTQRVYTGGSVSSAYMDLPRAELMEESLNRVREHLKQLVTTAPKPSLTPPQAPKPAPGSTLPPTPVPLPAPGPAPARGAEFRALEPEAFADAEAWQAMTGLEEQTWLFDRRSLDENEQGGGSPNAFLTMLEAKERGSQVNFAIFEPVVRTETDGSITLILWSGDGHTTQVDEAYRVAERIVSAQSQRVAPVQITPYQTHDHSAVVEVGIQLTGEGAARVAARLFIDDAEVKQLAEAAGKARVARLLERVAQGSRGATEGIHENIQVIAHASLTAAMGRLERDLTRMYYRYDRTETMKKAVTAIFGPREALEEIISTDNAIRGGDQIVPQRDLVVWNKVPYPTANVRADAGAMLGVAVAKQARKQLPSAAEVHDAAATNASQPQPVLSKVERLGLRVDHQDSAATVWVPQLKRVDDTEPRRFYRATVTAG